MTKRRAYGSGGRKSDSGADYRAATAALVAKATRKNPAKLVREVLGDREVEKGRVLTDDRPPKRG